MVKLSIKKVRNFGAFGAEMFGSCLGCRRFKTTSLIERERKREKKQSLLGNSLNQNHTDMWG